MAKALAVLVLVLVLVLIQCCVGIEEEHSYYKDPTQPVAARVRDLLRRMTLEEKIGQMAQIDRSVANELTMKTYSIGNHSHKFLRSMCLCIFLNGVFFLCIYLQGVF